MDGVPTVTGRFISKELYEVESEHYIVQVPLGAWEGGKIELFEGAGAKFIAPTNLVFKIKKAPIYFNYYNETCGNIRREPTLVYGTDWVNKETEHVPYTEEVRQILGLIKEMTGWRLPDWNLIVESEANRLANERGVPRDTMLDKDLFTAIQTRLLLKISGCIKESEVWGADTYNIFLSSPENTIMRRLLTDGFLLCGEKCLSPDLTQSGPRYLAFVEYAYLVRCVSD